MSDWTFEKISNNFENHVKAQLPWYPLVSEAIAFIVEAHCPKNGLIYDIGCSKRNLFDLLSKKLEERSITYLGIDSVKEMQPDIVADAVTFDYKNFDVAVLNLTLMFISLRDRKKLIKKLKKRMNKGGIIIIVDKFLGNGDYISVVFRRLTFLWKIKSQFSAEEILNKEMSLNGVQIPMSRSEIEGADMFFKFGEFEGWIIK